uniref:Protein kinase domain-containing protein n=1 Tax=Zooxanthella nutricula TaxID=1333877 RepID=A0A7S2MSS4_9DINO
MRGRWVDLSQTVGPRVLNTRMAADKCDDLYEALSTSENLHPNVQQPVASSAKQVRPRRYRYTCPELELEPRHACPEPELELEVRDGMGDLNMFIPAAWRENFEVPYDLVVGGGAFAQVYKVQDRRDGKHYAVKVMQRSNFELRGIGRQIDFELEAMRLAAVLDVAEGDRHIVRLFDHARENDHVFLRMELCEGGDLLRTMMALTSTSLNEDEAIVMARHLFLGLSQVHSLGFLHRDIKPENLLLKEGQLKITDFGWCCPAKSRPQEMAGTLVYMAPEVLRQDLYDEEVDVWSAGVTTYYMLVGRPLIDMPEATLMSECDPHGAMRLKQQRLLDQIAVACPPRVEQRPPHLSEQSWDFVRKSLARDPSDRLTVAAALDHSWLQLTQ